MTPNTVLAPPGRAIAPRDRAQFRRAETFWTWWSEDIDGSRSPRIGSGTSPLDTIELGGRASDWLRNDPLGLDGRGGA